MIYTFALQHGLLLPYLSNDYCLPCEAGGLPFLVNLNH